MVRRARSGRRQEPAEWAEAPLPLRVPSPTGGNDAAELRSRLSRAETRRESGNRQRSEALSRGESRAAQ